MSTILNLHKTGEAGDPRNRLPLLNLSYL